MAGNPNRLEAEPVDESWIGDEPLNAISVFSSDNTGEIPFKNVGPPTDWEQRVPTSSDRICSRYSDHCLPMYEVVFKEMGFRLPFTGFERKIIRWLDLAPSQLHPNAYPFMRAFELTCQHLGLTPTVPFFFSVFSLQRGTEKCGGKHWVSFRQPKKFFDPFTDSVRGFKERYFLVRPKTATARSNVLEIVKRPGSPGEGRMVPRIPFYWSKSHFSNHVSRYCFAYERLEGSERADYVKLRTFVEGFEPLVHLGEDGNPMVDDEGKAVTTARFIDTRALVLSQTPLTLLGNRARCLFMLIMSFAILICLV